MKTKNLLTILFVILSIVAIWRLNVTNETYILNEDFKGVVYVIECADKKKNYNQDGTFIIPENGILERQTGKNFGTGLIDNQKYYSEEITKQNRIKYVETIDEVEANSTLDRLAFRFQSGVTFNECTQKEIRYSTFLVSKPNVDEIRELIVNSTSPDNLKLLQDECYCE